MISYNLTLTETLTDQQRLLVWKYQDRSSSWKECSCHNYVWCKHWTNCTKERSKNYMRKVTRTGWSIVEKDCNVLQIAPG